MESPKKIEIEPANTTAQVSTGVIDLLAKERAKLKVTDDNFMNGYIAGFEAAMRLVKDSGHTT